MSHASCSVSEIISRLNIELHNIVILNSIYPPLCAQMYYIVFYLH